MPSIDVSEVKKAKDTLLMTIIPVSLALLILILGFKDIYGVLKSAKKSKKKIYVLFFIILFIFISIGIITTILILNENISLSIINEKILSKCYNNKLTEAKKKIIEECKGKE